MKNTINIENTTRAIVEGIAAIPSAGEHFKSALKNMDPWRLSEHRIGSASGIIMCYGDCEAMPALVRAYNQLKDGSTPEVFGKAVSNALKQFAGYFPEDGHNLCYVHFLLHGLVQSTTEGIEAKIVDNARIIIETQKIKDTLLSQGVAACTVPGFRMCMVSGQTDDFQGLSLRLEPEIARNDPLFAKIGFFVDPTNESAVVINVQGRQTYTSGLPPNRIREVKEDGRRYARFAATVGMEPRAYVLEQLFSFLSKAGVREVRAIRPEEHLMAIGGHGGFRKNYQSVFEQAGMTAQDQIYYCKKID